ncbi:uncharacterized protein LOC126793655 [Argentina anserina]|uniref:uncharacterized protein LOC126793655 n=1 Tax=Argentina anserina TaxID=57926 RepID=UPI00217633C0|nr:uncharacterized protein LOC126793655 [Potentilla anserina]
MANLRAVDHFEDKEDDHSTRKHPYNTECVGDNIEDKKDDHSTGKRPQTSQFKQIADVYAKLVEDAHRYHSDGHPVRILPADFAAKKRDDRIPRGYTSSSRDSLREGYGMVCKRCWVPNCRTGRYNVPMLMNCYYCKEHGKHFSYDCPSYRGPTMADHLSCFNWKKADPSRVKRFSALRNRSNSDKKK